MDARQRHPTEGPNEVHSAPLNIQTTTYVTFFSVVMAFSGWMMGFDSSYSGTVLQMRPFNDAFGSCTESMGVQICELNATAQSLSSISTLFTAIGSGLSGVTTHYIGRRATLQLGCVFVIIGASGQLGTSSSYVNYMVCKCIAGIGIGYFQVVGIAYAVECMPARTRGTLTAFFAIGLSLGTLLISVVCLASSKLDSNWAWKTPIACAIPISAIYILVLLFFPESPRWLMLKDKEHEARRSFSKFYGVEPLSEIVSRQIQETKAGLEFEITMSATTSWTEIFHGKYIRRTLISASILVSASFCGTYFIVPYAAIFLGGLGIQNPFLINVIMGACGTIGTSFGPLLVEYLGRRRTLLVGYALMACCMLIFSAVSTGLGSGTTRAENVLVAFICIWYFTYGCCILSAGWLASSEMHSVRLRAPGQAFVGLIAQVTSFAASFWTPYMLNKEYGNMGTNVGYFYFGLTVIIWMVMFWLVPETARLSLEEIDHIFDAGAPAWKSSLKKNRKKAGECGLSRETKSACGK
jgi:sugar porter (SP) family MFS transporter